MKKLAILMCAILILGCGTETTVVEQPSPIVVSGEHLRIDIDKPQLIAGSVRDGEINVDPELINAAGLRFDFHENLKLRKVDFFREGEPLNWLGTGLSDHVTPTVILIPFAGMELQFDTEYVIKMYVQDLACISSRVEIRFRTMPKP